MSSKTLCYLVRAAVIAVAVCGLAMCGLFLPPLVADTAGELFGLTESYCWLAFLWVSALPCFAILVYVWKCSDAIKNENVFRLRVARWVKHAAMLLFCDVVFFFLGNTVFWLIGLNHPSVLIASLLICVLGAALATAAAAVSRYITKAAALQEEADGTI
ncbi:MAG: DUF2975 domain-containing protein [Oscillospiraceae bacterium]|jgi:hypothetical protein|nr:DUF2975 domain-containing protein [Oscillospiraceae bacterium]